MTSRQKIQWQRLCLRAVKEPDPVKQIKIVAELNRLLQNGDDYSSTHRAPKSRRSR